MAEPRSVSPPSIPAAALEAINAPRAPDAPRRCFICLTDQDPSDPPNSWVDPCPCTLEAHQDCMLSWVTDCERSGKPLKCPVCKELIALEGPWDPVVALSDAVQKRFTHASPFMLFTSVSLGIQFSSQMYGAMAMWMFAGRDALMQFMLGPDMMIDGRHTRGLKFARVGNAAILMNVAPALLIGQLLPGLGNKIFVPTASLYGIYHVMHDEQFVTWPPSPQLAIAVFPYIRSIYYNLWREFVFPYELSLNRQILGLPPVDPRQNADGNRGNRRNADREGGIIGFLQSVLDALDPDDDGHGGPRGGIQIQRGDAGDNGDNAQEGGVMIDVEVVIEEEIGGDDGEAEAEGQDNQEEGHRAAEMEPDVQAGLPDQDQGAAPAPDVPLAPAEAAAPEDQGQGEAHDHEVPQAPPANRPGLGAILSNVSNALVSALILPGISFAMGEALRLTLPTSWTAGSRLSHRGNPGLLQQQWGRSLVGGCLYVVLKDVVRLYAKQRKVASLGNRRVKNVDRPRRTAGNTTQQ